MKGGPETHGYSQDLGRTLRVKWLCIGSGWGGDAVHRFQDKWSQGSQPTLQRTREALREIEPGKLSGSDWVWEVSFWVLLEDRLERDKTKWRFCHQVRNDGSLSYGLGSNRWIWNKLCWILSSKHMAWVSSGIPGGSARKMGLLDKNGQLYSWCPRGWLPFKFCPDSKGWVDQEDWWKALLSISAVYILLTFRSRLPQYELLITSLQPWI